MILADEAATARLGSALAERVRPGDVIALSGPLGVGKTALARSMIHFLGHSGEVPSPTFAIEQAGEIDELGLEGAEDAVLLVEWPERAGAKAWPNALRLGLDFDQGGARRLTASVPEAWRERWPPD